MKDTYIDPKGEEDIKVSEIVRITGSKTKRRRMSTEVMFMLLGWRSTRKRRRI